MIGLSLTAAFSVIVIVALFFPQYSCKVAGFWTLAGRFIMLVLWQFVPAVRIFPNVIYMEWFACILTYAVVAVLQPGKSLRQIQPNNFLKKDAAASFLQDLSQIQLILIWV